MAARAGTNGGAGGRGRGAMGAALQSSAGWDHRPRPGGRARQAQLDLVGVSGFLSLPSMKGLHGWARTGDSVCQTTEN